MNQNRGKSKHFGGTCIFSRFSNKAKASKTGNSNKFKGVEFGLIQRMSKFVAQNQMQPCRFYGVRKLRINMI